MTTLESWLANGFEPLSDRTAEINAYGIRALAYRRRDERDLALQPLERAVDLIAQSTPPLTTV